MRSARLEDGELRIVERPSPEPRHEEAVVRITGGLSELPAILDELEAGAYTGRAVITDLSD